MATWLDRNVYKAALNLSTGWDGSVGTYDLPSLKDMTLKAIDILSTRSKEDGDTGFMLMSEAASIDKQVRDVSFLSFLLLLPLLFSTRRFVTDCYHTFINRCMSSTTTELLESY